MAIIRWEPARELHTVQSEINRLFGSLFDTPTHPGVRPQPAWVPATDLVETENEYVLSADLPGLSQEDVSIKVEGNVLTVAGERVTHSEEQGQGRYRLERASGSFRRSLRLPAGVDAEAITASFDKGVLEVHVPKPVAAQPRTVEITAGGAAAPAIETPEAPAAA
jgi:HSP20 family protein